MVELLFVRPIAAMDCPGVDTFVAFAAGVVTCVNSAPGAKAQISEEFVSCPRTAASPFPSQSPSV
jgi:hypothetical protein